jgi:hypothetical protein
MRSPNYPSVSLAQAIELTGKIHKANRTNVIDRESAARDMGYSGLTGRSLKVLAALLQFGLLSKAGKGQVKVTQTAVDILFGIDPEDIKAALLKAGTSPSLFQELHSRFPDGPPSENSIRSYLIQQGFADVAIGPAITAYMDTYHHLENIRDSESHGGEADEFSQLALPTQETPVQQQLKPPLMAVTDPRVVAAFANEAPDLNKINMDIRGDRVLVSGLLDLKGLRLLKKRIEGLEALLAPFEDEDALIPLAEDIGPDE